MDARVTGRPWYCIISRSSPLVARTAVNKERECNCRGAVPCLFSAPVFVCLRPSCSLPERLLSRSLRRYPAAAWSFLAATSSSTAMRPCRRTRRCARPCGSRRKLSYGRRRGGQRMGARGLQFRAAQHAGRTPQRRDAQLRLLQRRPCSVCAGYRHQRLGAVALLRAAHPEWDTVTVVNALRATAAPPTPSLSAPQINVPAALRYH